MDLQINWDRQAGVLVASPVGRVDSASSAQFQEALESGIPSEERALLLDLRHLTYLSSAGLRVLLVVTRKFRQSHQTIAMCELSRTIRSIVSLSGFDKIIPVYGSLAEAIEAVAAKDGSAKPKRTVDEKPAPDEDRSGPRRWSFKMHSN